MSLERVSDDRKSSLKQLIETKGEPLKGVTLGGNTLEPERFEGDLREYFES